MPIRLQTKILSLPGLLFLLVWLGGCADMSGYAPAPPPELTPEQQVKVGSLAGAKLLQMLGGPYHDEALVEELNRPGRAHGQGIDDLQVAVADRSLPALYALPGGRVIVTRGLLSEIRTPAGLNSLLGHAAHLAHQAYSARTTRSMVEATWELLSTSEPVYDPDSAAIRLARSFQKTPCAEQCLAVIRSADAAATVGFAGLPEALQRLASLKPGYDLLVRARQLESADDQAQAVATYLQAAAASPDEPLILGSLGLAYLRAGQLQPGRLHLQRAVKLQPDYFRTRMGLGYLYLQMGKFNEANEILASSVRLLAVMENLFLLAEAREKSGDLKEAKILYQLVVNADRSGKLGRTSASRLAQLSGVQ